MKTPVTIPLTDSERQLFEAHKTTISAGFTTFREVGIALLDIQEKRLYRETHGSFEPFCQEVWQMSARRAYQLCEAAKVVLTLPDELNHGSQLNERQVRELAKVEPSKRAEVLEKTKAAGKVTAKAIKEIASEPTERPRVESYTIESKDNDGQVVAGITLPLPDISPLELKAIEELEICIADSQLVIDAIREQALDNDTLGALKLHFQLTSKVLQKLQVEAKLKAA